MVGSYSSSGNLDEGDIAIQQPLAEAHRHKLGIDQSQIGIERADQRARPKRVRPTFNGVVPNMLRGTVKQHVALLGYTKEYRDEYQPLIGAGYGLVVNLKGTGSQDVPPQVRSHMIADLAKRGVGETTRGWGNLTPELLLDSKDTAVVIVEGIIPQVAKGRKSALGPKTTTTVASSGTAPLSPSERGRSS